MKTHPNKTILANIKQMKQIQEKSLYQITKPFKVKFKNGDRINNW